MTGIWRPSRRSLSAEVASVAVGQSDVEEDGVVAGVVVGEQGLGGGGAFGLVGAELAAGEDLLGHGGAEVGVVFDDQDAAQGGHGSLQWVTMRYHAGPHYRLKVDNTARRDVKQDFWIKKRDYCAASQGCAGSGRLPDRLAVKWVGASTACASI